MLVAEEDPVVAAEAAAVGASARPLAVADPARWAAAGWTARTVRPVLRVVGAVAAAGWEDQDQEDGAAAVEAVEEAGEDLDRRREEVAEADPAAVMVQDLVDLADPARTAAETITACTAVTADTAALVVMLGTMAISAVVAEVEGLHQWEEIPRLISRSPLIAAAVAAEEEVDQAEALGLPGLALHPDRTTHSLSNRSTSNRIDMAMVGMDSETIVEVVAVAVATDLLPPSNPTRIRALHRNSGKTIRARIRHNTTDRQDLVVVVVEWVQAAIYRRQRGEPPITSQEWEEAEV